MKSVHRTLLLLSVCAGSIGFGACIASANGDDRNDRGHVHGSAAQDHSFGQPGSIRDVARTIVLTMSDAMRFEPDALAIARGETVRLHIVNEGKLEHEFVLGTSREIDEHARMMRDMPGMAHADANAVRVAPGKSADVIWKFSVSGTFQYACLVPGHHEAGMRGVVKVAGGGRL